MRRTTRFFFAAATLLLGAGCELIATVDRSQIDQGTGGGDTGGTGGTAGAGGTAGMAGAGGTAGMGGTGGTGGTAGMGGTGGTGGTAGMGGTGGTAGMGGTGGTGGTAGMGGTGGTGGTAGMGGGGGAGGGGMPCQTPTDCPATGNECITATCDAGMCGTAFVLAGTAVSSQITADCKVDQCDGAGNVMSANDDTDVLDDQKECTTDVCNNGTPSNDPVVAGTMCGAGMALVCDGSGECVGCVTGADCPGNDTECQTRTCTAGVCGFSNATQGTVLQNQTPNDCSTAVCDGQGGVTGTFDGADLPADDNNACTTAACDMQNGPVQNPVAIDDSNACTTDACDPVGGVSHTPVAIDDSNACTTDACDPVGGVSHTPVAIDDSNACTTDACDPVGGVSHTPVAIDDSNACTTDACDPVGGVSHTPVAIDDSNACTTDACDPVGGVSHTPVAIDDSNACTTDACDPVGGVSHTPVAIDDSNACTADACHPVTGVSHTNLPPGTMCNQNGGTECDGNGNCIVPAQCVVPTDCPGTDTECQTRTCQMGQCGFSYAAPGAPTSTQVSGDCKQNVCDGSGNEVSAVDNIDVPNDSNECTGDICTAGVPSNPPLTAGTPCTAGGTECDGNGVCTTPVLPTVVSTTPTDGAMPDASSTISVTFSMAMNPSTLTGQTAAGPCSGSIQVSLDEFTTCIAFSSANATMSAGDTVATLTPAPGMLVNRVYKTRVTTAATSATGTPLDMQHTHPTGFLTKSPNLCNDSVVISQVYGGGGNTGAPYTHDFVELHNRGTSDVDVTNWSLQYTSATGTSWGSSKFTLNGTIPAGGYFLVQFAGGANGNPLPTPDQTGSITMSGTSGKVALVSSTTSLAANVCATGPDVVDFVGYGTANCQEGLVPVGALSNSTGAIRVQNGCGDVNENSVDFAVAAPNPRNSATPAVVCACTVENEANTPLEADYCNVQFPLSVNVQTGTPTPTIYGQIYDTGTTEAGGANANVRSQLGWGVASANPQYQAGWTWLNATYSAQIGNNDEYQASFTAPAPGDYRYVYRVSLDQGVSWTVCDQNLGDFGAGSNAGLEFTFADMPIMTVNP